LRRIASALALALAASLAAAPAFAQTVFPTPQPGVVVGGMIQMCPTANLTYVPCGSPGALPRPVTVTGAVGMSQPQVITGIGTGTTGAVTGTLATVPGKTAYLCGFDVSAVGGTAAIGPVTVTGLLNGTFTYQFFSSASGATLSRTFTPCVPAANQTQSIAVVTTADGTASAVDVNVFGLAQ
jgi:hypothetical protein